MIPYPKLSFKGKTYSYKIIDDDIVNYVIDVDTETHLRNSGVYGEDEDIPIEVINDINCALQDVLADIPWDEIDALESSSQEEKLFWQ